MDSGMRCFCTQDMLSRHLTYDAYQCLENINNWESVAGIFSSKIFYPSDTYKEMDKYLKEFQYSVICLSDDNSYPNDDLAHFASLGVHKSCDEDAPEKSPSLGLSTSWKRSPVIKNKESTSAPSPLVYEYLFTYSFIHPFIYLAMKWRPDGHHPDFGQNNCGLSMLEAPNRARFSQKQHHRTVLVPWK